MASRRLQLTISGIFVLLCLAVLARQIAHYYFLTDDAFISYRYAKNLIDGHGLVFNPGEHVEGYTNFLWVLLTSVGLALGAAADIWANALSIIATAGVLIMISVAAGRLFESKGYLAALGIVLLYLCVNRSFTVWATGGMETRLFTLLVLAGTLFSPLLHSGERRLAVSSVLFGLAAITRMEALLFFGVISLIELFATRGMRTWRREEFLRWFGPLVTLVGGHLIFRLTYYGMPLPNTFYVKVGSPHFSLGAKYLLAFVLEYQLWLLAPLLAAGLWAKGAAPTRLWKSALLWPPYLIYLAYIGGDHFEFRMLDVMIPFLALYLGAAAAAVWRRLPALVSRLASLALMAAVVVFATAAVPWGGEESLPKVCSDNFYPRVNTGRHAILRHLPGFREYCNRYSDQYRALRRRLCAVRAEEHRIFVGMVTEQARIFDDYLRNGVVSKDASICVPYVGVIPYYTGLETVDWHGLTDSAVAHSEPVAEDIFNPRRVAHEKRASWEYLRFRKVDYVYAVGGLGFFTEKYPAGGAEPESYIVLFPNHFFVFRSTREAAEIIDRFKDYPVHYLEHGHRVRTLNEGERR